MESKISFLGDIMCEKPFLRAAHTKKGYDFSMFLAPCKELFRNSELVIGNLETPCDPYSSPTKDMFIFNAPKEFVEALKDNGITCLTTASNHCLDRGLCGLRNTIKVLDDLGFHHTGTFLAIDEDRFLSIRLSNGTVVSILSYTYGSNYLDNKTKIEDKDLYAINHLTPLYAGRNTVNKNADDSLRARVTRLIPRSLRIRINNVLGRKSNLSYEDCLQDGDVDEENQRRIKESITAAEAVTDITIVCPHFGGQFNINPGSYVNTFVDFFDQIGVSLVLGNHPHIVQRYEIRQSGMRVAYSLGNVSMSLSTPYVIKDDLPECSIMFHVYIDNGIITKTSFSILIEKETKSGYITVHPLFDLFENSSGNERDMLGEKCRVVYNRFMNTNQENIPIQKEYIIQ